MQRSELEHIIRACGDVAQDDEIVNIGSRSILGQFPDAPIRLLASMEADVYPNHNPSLADEIDGAIGEGSSFHEMHGYYAQGVGSETAVLPGCVSKHTIWLSPSSLKGDTKTSSSFRS